MKITDVELIRLRSPRLTRPLVPAWTPGMPVAHREAALVRVATDEGVEGWGAISVHDAMGTAVNGWLKPQLLGKDPFALEQHARLFSNAGGAWGVEIALWDIIGQATGQPLHKLWGGHKDRVPGYASFMETHSGARRGEDVAACRAQGWRAVKLRLHDWTVRQDIAQVEGVRKAMGDDFVILVDANQAQQPGTRQVEKGPVWTYGRALQTARELERLGVFWLEEPLGRYQFEILARLADAVEIMHIAGGENNRGLHEYRWMIERGVYDVIQPESMVSETMSSLRKVCGLAEMHHKLVAPHHGGGGIGLVAHLHLACGVPNSTYFEMLCEPGAMTTDDFQWYLEEPVGIDADGNVVAPSRPGLGVRPDAAKVARDRIA